MGIDLVHALTPNETIKHVYTLANGHRFTIHRGNHLLMNGRKFWVFLISINELCCSVEVSRWISTNLSNRLLHKKSIHLCDLESVNPSLAPIGPGNYPLALQKLHCIHSTSVLLNSLDEMAALIEYKSYMFLMARFHNAILCDCK